MTENPYQPPGDSPTPDNSRDPPPKPPRRVWWLHGPVPSVLIVALTLGLPILFALAFLFLWPLLRMLFT